MTDFKKYWLPRIVVGAVVGIAAHVLLGYLLGCFGPLSSGFHGFHFPDCRMYRFFGLSAVWDTVGVLLSFALWALFGAEVAVATIPFADDGRELVVHSLIHYLVTSATVCLWAGLNVCSHYTDYFTFLIPLTLVYLLVWLGRWVGWYTEVAAIREKLGLPPKTSPLKWQETLPYFGYAFLLCLILPLVLRQFDAADVPVLLELLFPWLLLPVAAFIPGISLGKRQGFCPLYPVACVGFILVFILLTQRFSSLGLILIALLASLLGNLAGAAWRNMKSKKGV